MNRLELLDFIRRNSIGVEATVSLEGHPQAALIGLVVSEQFEIFFDTLTSSRKCRNLRLDPRIALVIGWDMNEEQTLQIEGIADEPRGMALDALKKTYFAHFPEGMKRELSSDIAYFRVTVTWARFSDFRQPGPTIIEFSAAELR